MSFTINETKNYDQAVPNVYQAALGAIDGLGGKVEKQDAGSGRIEVKFDKKILGKTLGDRTHMNVQVSAAGDGSTVSTETYPLDAIGRKLMFGARKGVSKTVTAWFFAHLEHRL